MDEYIIFSTPMVWVLLSVVVLAYVVETVLHRLISEYRKKADAMVSNSATLVVMKLLAIIISLINLAVHVLGFIGLLFIKAKLEETLFLLMISIALALTANRIKGEE